MKIKKGDKHHKAFISFIIMKRYTLIILSFFFVAPIHSSHTQVRIITFLSHILTCLEQFSSLSRILFCYRSVTNFTLQETLEIFPVRFLAIQVERVLAFCFQSRVVTPQVPVTAL